MLLLAGASPPARAQSDEQWAFSNSGTASYLLTSVSSASLFPGALPAADPTISLVVGTRYAASVGNFAAHPLQVLAKGATASTDQVLLSQGSTVGLMEADPDVAFSDSGSGTVTFTLTQGLVDAMGAGGRIPGYRCGAHVGSMRGDFSVEVPPPVPVAPAPVLVGLALALALAAVLRLGRLQRPA
jgi:hypothetical protein